MKEEEETNIKCTMYFVKVATNYKDQSTGVSSHLTLNGAMVLGKIVHNAKKILQTLLITSDKVGLELNTVESEYIFMSSEQNMGGGGGCWCGININIANKSYENVAELKHFITCVSVYVLWI